ncbi:uncharacterized protein LOC131219453 [Magnolia sinica]|uniref:uncharacterized protein LOC131219453 n=1 Tax=Magnolia sinica TaxID=86752 RepID=UPI00265A90C6|nr:uncharacterized protein LOC131219453 [Magnolia sinica]
MENTDEIQMGSSPSSHFKNQLISFALLLLIFSLLPISLLSPTFLTFLALILSTVVFFTFIKKKQILQENSIQDDEIPPIQVPQNAPEMEVGLKLQPETDIAELEKETRKEGDVGQIHQPIVGSPDLLSDSEGLDLLSSTSNNSEADWSFQYNVGQIPAARSEDSISDDDSLIEIALPGGRYVRSDEPEGLWPNSPEFSPEPAFHQHGIMGLLSEINEEDNLIEIDISVGSIKCSRVEIKA